MGELTALLTSDLGSLKNIVSENISRDRGFRAISEASYSTLCKSELKLMLNTISHLSFDWRTSSKFLNLLTMFLNVCCWNISFLKIMCFSYKLHYATARTINIMFLTIFV